ncbi:MAG: helix-turn-helix transcriptional regulator, partial [Clostridia bacterium]|nr:helix-turn-helix transcriptional regulator [Clostridia bacterium]
LAEAISFINENYADRGLSLKVTAAQVYLSPYYISHLFRYELNTTFVEYLTRVRIDKAKELLAAGVSCEETAERAGFRDASYFTKIFKKFVGITPAKYRKKQ